MEILKQENEYDIKQLLEFIKRNFGSLRRFNDLTNRPVFDLYYLKHFKFKKDNSWKQVKQKLYQDIKNNLEAAIYLTAKDRMLLQHTILNKYRTITNFCQEHPNFSRAYLSGIVNGRFKKITPKTKKLLEILELDNIVL